MTYSIDTERQMEEVRATNKQYSGLHFSRHIALHTATFYIDILLKNFSGQIKFGGGEMLKTVIQYDIKVYK